MALKVWYCDVWATPYPTVCVLTNTTVRNGVLVMGGGIAAEANRLSNGCAALEGAAQLARNGEQPSVHKLCVVEALGGTKTLVAFPTKQDVRRDSTLELIEQSMRGLIRLIDAGEVETPVALPKPGCGLGGLDWDVVGPLVESLLAGYEDRVVIVDYARNHDR